MKQKKPKKARAVRGEVLECSATKTLEFYPGDLKRYGYQERDRATLLPQQEHLRLLRIERAAKRVRDEWDPEAHALAENELMETLK